MVGIDVQVALRLDFEIDEPVTGHLIEHVIEKRHAGLKLGLARAIQIDGNSDLGLQGIA